MKTNSRKGSLHGLRNPKNLKTERLQRLHFIPLFLSKIHTFNSTNTVLILISSRINRLTEYLGEQNRKKTVELPKLFYNLFPMPECKPPHTALEHQDCPHSPSRKK